MPVTIDPTVLTTLKRVIIDVIQHTCGRILPPCSSPRWSLSSAAHRRLPSLKERRASGWPEVFKIMILIKRRAGLSMDAFIDYYENRHAPLGLRAVPNMKGYTRRYLTPLGGGEELPYDVATEIAFDDEADFGRAMEYLNEPATRAEVDADEERLFDRSTITFMKVDERSSAIPARS